MYRETYSQPFPAPFLFLAFKLPTVMAEYEVKGPRYGNGNDDLEVLVLPPGVATNDKSAPHQSESVTVQAGHVDTEAEARIYTLVDKVKFFIISSVGFFSDGYFNGSWSYGERGMWQYRSALEPTSLFVVFWSQILRHIQWSP